ncbi:hypothetical protein [Candidatus Ichthyocystis hellenicum]|uniref:hypothetical protein n=1 Tax=Candidatus Ichthyocystis hellenicum TaxID=1561003 RepID=UPI00111278A4|nr:hypothetical protein [Candidatus Ichthyocystis hellenicum]
MNCHFRHMHGESIDCFPSIGELGDCIRIGSNDNLSLAVVGREDVSYFDTLGYCALKRVEWRANSWKDALVSAAYLYGGRIIYRVSKEDSFSCRDGEICPECCLSILNQNNDGSYYSSAAAVASAAEEDTITEEENTAGERLNIIEIASAGNNAVEESYDIPTESGDGVSGVIIAVLAAVFIIAALLLMMLITYLCGLIK